MQNESSRGGAGGEQTSDFDMEGSLRRSEFEEQLIKRKRVKRQLKELVQRLEIVELKIESRVKPHEFDLVDIESKIGQIAR